LLAAKDSRSRFVSGLTQPKNGDRIMSTRIRPAPLLVILKGVILKGVILKGVILQGAFLLSSSPALAGDEHDDAHRYERQSPCERTAETMLRACHFDVGDNLYTAIANCQNLADADERADCLADARVERREEAALCGEIAEARLNVCELTGEWRYDPDPLTGFSLTGTPIEFVDPDEIPAVWAPNPFVSLVPGHTHVLRAGDEFAETIVVHVTDMTREILGVTCRVVVDIVLEANDEGELEAVEVTDDWFAQSTTGDVYYCGELARNYEEGRLTDIDGSFEAGRNSAKAGLLISANPIPGLAHRQEFALGEAEDTIRYVGIDEVPGDDEGGENGVSDAFGCALNGGCVKTEEFIPPDPSAGEYKYYLPGIGFVLGIALEDGEPTGDRDELVCYGDSLTVLGDANCGIDDVEMLIDELCRLAPDAFCASND
jgi:hypothetical protein